MRMRTKRKGRIRRGKGERVERGEGGSIREGKGERAGIGERGRIRKGRGERVERGEVRMRRGREEWVGRDKWR